MDVEQFLQELGLPANADLDPVERKFMEVVKERIQRVADSYDEDAVQAEEQWLRDSFRCFFEHALNWAHKEASKYQSVQQHPEAEDVKKQAKNVVSELQDYITEFSSCYMHINRFMTLLRDEIKKEEIKMGAPVPKNTRWTSDSGTMIARYRKEKQDLLERTERMGRAREVLEAIEDDFNAIRRMVTDLFGKDKAEPLIRRYNASLRVGDFRKARKALKEIGETKKRFGIDQKTADQHQKQVETLGNKIIDTIREEEKLLISEDNKFFLKPLETDLAYNADVRQLKKIKGFLAKYHLPYMQYKLDTLYHLKDKLLVLHSLEGLMTMYKRLVMGIAVPMKEIKVIRLYESEVLNNIQYLLHGHFQELPNILERAEENVREFRRSRDEYDEMDKIKLEEIEVDQKKAARA